MTDQETAQYLLSKALLQGGILSPFDQDEARRVLGIDGMTKEELSKATWALLETINQEGRRLELIDA